jgi:hypothetical protein
MGREDISGLIEELTASIGPISTRDDPEIHSLLKAVTSAFSSNDNQGLLQASRRIEQHALHRYAGVVESAGALSRKLEAR